MGKAREHVRYQHTHTKQQVEMMHSQYSYSSYPYSRDGIQCLLSIPNQSDKCKHNLYFGISSEQVSWNYAVSSTLYIEVLAWKIVKGKFSCQI